MANEDDFLADVQAAIDAGERAEQQQQSAADAEKPEGDKPEGKAADAEPETPADPDAAAATPGKEDGEGKDGEPKADDGDDDGEGDKPKPKTSRAERYKRQIDRLARENQELRSRQQAGSQSEPEIASEVEKVIGKPPKEEDFKGDYLAFERAQTVYELRKATTEDRLREQAASARTAQETARAERMRDAADAHHDRVEEFRKKVPDFDAVLKAASNLKASPTVEELILDSEKSDHLVYHLAKNPDRLAKLNAMSERDAAREIGRIESRLSLPQPKKQTSAPKPVTPPKGGVAPSSPDKDIDDYIKQTYG